MKIWIDYVVDICLLKGNYQKVPHFQKPLGMLFDMVEPWMGHTIGKF